MRREPVIQLFPSVPVDFSKGTTPAYLVRSSSEAQSTALTLPPVQRSIATRAGSDGTVLPSRHAMIATWVTLRAFAASRGPMLLADRNARNRSCPGGAAGFCSTVTVSVVTTSGEAVKGVSRAVSGKRCYRPARGDR